MKSLPLDGIAVIREPAALFARAQVRKSRRSDGSVLLSSPQALGSYPRALSEHLLHWARAAPERAFLCERGKDGAWRRLSYAAARDEVLGIAGWLVSQGFAARQLLAILSDNSIEHALLTLAAMHVGMVATPISPAYSLLSSDFSKLRSIIERTAPTLLYVDDYARYAPALRAMHSLCNATLIVGSASATTPADAICFNALKVSDAEVQVARAFAAVTGDTVAKLLFTSGSTDEPKGVINTQRMLCSNQQAKAQVWPFLESQPPVIVDWLPWNHTFGGNHNFNLVLRNGGTLYIDAGRPVPTLFAQTLNNLRDVAPTIYFNVPRGYELLIPNLQADEVLCRKFFSRLQLLFYAAASLPPHLWDALTKLSLRSTGAPMALVSGWGSTETAPLVTDCHFLADRAGVIGLPVPGCELKLVSDGNKLEVRVRGPNVSPGYWGRPDLTALHFDQDGFYCIGDAVRFVDESAPERGLIFDGRLAENFKLSTGTWVNVGNLRVQAIAALAPIAQDIVVAGHDRSEVSFLIFPNIAACQGMCRDVATDTPVEQLLQHRLIREHVRAGLVELKRQAPGSSCHAVSALLLPEPPSIDAGEITDKGYINQRAVLARRQQSVSTLLRSSDPSIVTLSS